LGHAKIHTRAQNATQKKRKTQLGPTGSVIGGAIDEVVLEKICDLALGASTSMERMAASTMGSSLSEGTTTMMLERLINEDIRSVLAEESTLSEETQGDLLRALRKCSEPSDHVRALMYAPPFLVTFTKCKRLIHCLA
jgi:hypothetical protein